MTFPAKKRRLSALRRFFSLFVLVVLLSVFAGVLFLRNDYNHKVNESQAAYDKLSALRISNDKSSDRKKITNQDVYRLLKRRPDETLDDPQSNIIDKFVWKSFFGSQVLYVEYIRSDQPLLDGLSLNELPR